jgi:hypothetical protein
MKLKLNTTNELKNEVEKLELHKKSQFCLLEANSIIDFPILNVEFIKTYITLGTYQLSQSLGN